MRLRDGFAPVEIVQWARKEDCSGCVALRDEIGRLPIGFCGPDCLMKRERDDFIKNLRGRLLN